MPDLHLLEWSRNNCDPGLRREASSKRLFYQDYAHPPWRAPCGPACDRSNYIPGSVIDTSQYHFPILLDVSGACPVARCGVRRNDSFEYLVTYAEVPKIIFSSRLPAMACALSQDRMWCTLSHLPGLYCNHQVYF